MKKGILIPPSGKPYVIEFEYNYKTINKLLNTKWSDYRCISWMNDKGYDVCICYPDMPPVLIQNHIASIIGQTDMFNVCLLFDDKKDLTMEDFDIIFKFNKSFDFSTYMKEKNVMLNKFLGKTKEKTK